MKNLATRLSLTIVILGVSLFCTAQNLPQLNMIINDSSATQGYYFLIPYTNQPPYIYDHAQLILDHFGRIIFYRPFPAGGNPNSTIDFKLQPNGQMSYFNTNRSKFFIMDSSFVVVDSIDCVHDYRTDQHDLQITIDNHYLLFSTETRIMNLTSYNYFGANHTLPGGANAEVFGVVIQEFDSDKDLIWEWKGHDHYQFSDVDPIWLSNPNKVDWTHANAVERDIDGNILISLRHFNEITKIDYATGNILWRLGGKQNQFTFPNDPVRFTGQHDIRRVSDSSISLFDNGQYSTPRMSRALEYALNETNKTATLVWDYIYDSTMYSLACGNHQYIENGNHLVDFGFTISGFPWMVVVKPDQSMVAEFHYPFGYTSYRAFNYINLPWQLNRPEVECQKIGDNYFLVAEPGHPEYRWSTGAGTSSVQIADTGDYWVLVPYGTGFISSEHIRVYDVTNPCLFLGTQASVNPTGFDLSAIPNPAKGHTQIAFTLPGNSMVSVSLHSLLGKEIGRPVSGFYPAGIHKIPMDVSALNRGIYMLSMVANDTRIVKKLIIN